MTLLSLQDPPLENHSVSGFHMTAPGPGVRRFASESGVNYVPSCAQEEFGSLYTPVCFVNVTYTASNAITIGLIKLYICTIKRKNI